MKKILVVEDDDNWQYTLRLTLKDAGYQVLVAPDRELAVKLLTKEIPNLVTMDGRLCGVNGLEIAKEIRKIDPKVPIVMLTGEGDVKFEGRGLDKGQFDADTFLALIAEILGQ